MATPSINTEQGDDRIWLPIGDLCYIPISLRDDKRFQILLDTDKRNKRGYAYVGFREEQGQPFFPVVWWKTVWHQLGHSNSENRPFLHIERNDIPRPEIVITQVEDSSSEDEDTDDIIEEELDTRSLPAHIEPNSPGAPKETGEPAYTPIRPPTVSPLAPQTQQPQPSMATQSATISKTTAGTTPTTGGSGGGQSSGTTQPQTSTPQVPIPLSNADYERIVQHLADAMGRGNWPTGGGGGRGGGGSGGGGGGGGGGPPGPFGP